MVRLQKYLADCGVASRRKCEELITRKMVTVNGEIIDELGVKVDEINDVVCVNDKEVKIQEKKVYIIIHKPEGYVTTVEDQFARPTVLDLIKEDITQRIYPVGRLDYDTSGLLLLTNDGDLTFKLTHPKHEVSKTYIASVMGTPTIEELKEFQNGLYIDGYKTSKASIVIVKTENEKCSLKISIKEGRNRQVRKMCEAINHPVVGLKRIATGNLMLGELKRGEYRFLTSEEIEYLKEL